ncbi:MAG: hypothetical protein AB2L17_02855 [Lentimicrobium sp.]
MKIFLIALILTFVFLFLKDKYYFNGIKDKLKFYLMKIELAIRENPYDPLNYCRRGSIYQRMQDFPKANKDFKYAIKLIEDGHPVYKKDELISRLILNIKYTEKPLPWSKKGPKDLSKSALTFFLIERFGNLRSQF